VPQKSTGFHHIHIEIKPVKSWVHPIHVQTHPCIAYQVGELYYVPIISPFYPSIYSYTTISWWKKKVDPISSPINLIISPKLLLIITPLLTIVPISDPWRYPIISPFCRQYIPIISTLHPFISHCLPVNLCKTLFPFIFPFISHLSYLYPLCSLIYIPINIIP
jgi:hypothetical protein